jgi:hypothetical protein
LLGPGEAGRAGPILTTGVVRGDGFAMTIEPAGGTREPTTTPILIISLHA